MSDLPWEKNATKINHKDNGYDVKALPTRQRPYGDTYRDFTIKTDKPESEVIGYCTTHVYKCSLTTNEYLADERAGVKDFGDHFRNNYKFSRVKEGEYLYQVIQPSTS